MRKDGLLALCLRSRPLEEAVSDESIDRKVMVIVSGGRERREGGGGIKGTLFTTHKLQGIDWYIRYHAGCRKRQNPGDTAVVIIVAECSPD